MSEEEDPLPIELWCLIGSKLDALNRIRFRAVSKLFMSLIPKQPPWLMLAQTEEGQESDSDIEDQDGDAPSMLESRKEEASVPPPRRGFVCLGEQQIVEIDFPQLHMAMCVGSRGNWLITIHKDRTIRLLNPFSRQQFYLPPGSEFDLELDQGPKLRNLRLWKIVLSSTPSDKLDCIAMALYTRHSLAIARVGDSKWTPVKLQPGLDRVIVKGPVEDMCFYKGKFYAVTMACILLEVDLGDALNPPTYKFLNTSFEREEIFRTYRSYITCYLVEWLGELLMVNRFVKMNYDQKTYTTDKFIVRKFDFVHKEWIELKSLGEHSLFVGYNTSISLCASDYFGAMRKNCIYFTDNFITGFRGLRIPGGRDMGVYDLEDHSFTPHFEGVSTCRYSPPVWVFPT